MKIALTAALALGTVLPAQAAVEFAYGANVSESIPGPVSGLIIGVGDSFSETLTGGTLTTFGPRSASAGGSTASVSAIADAAHGVFKAQTSVQASRTGWASAYASFILTDTLRFSGPTPTVDVTFTIAWDSFISGVGFLANPIYSDDSPPPITLLEEALGFRTLTTTVINDDNSHDTHTLVRGVGGSAQQAGGQVDAGPVEPDAPLNGIDSGNLVMVVTVPTNRDLLLSYSATNMTTCRFVPRGCTVDNDAFHSDYLGVSVGQGVNFTSANDYRYDAYAAAVPEPATWAMVLLGLAGLGLRRRA